jgi:hypothetical protein
MFLLLKFDMFIYVVKSVEHNSFSSLCNTYDSRNQKPHTNANPSITYKRAIIYQSLLLFIY